MLRRAIASAVRERVAGPGGSSHAAALLGADGPRWFGPDRPIRHVHADPSMFVGGLTALLLQTLHPLAMAGVAQHSDYRNDPWGRLQRTARFLATTTYGTADQADEACRVVRAIHERVRGVAPDGRPYTATDPHLLRWVHVAELDSFLSAHTAYGGRPLDQEGRDAYVADMAVVARALGVADPPRTEAHLRQQLRWFRPELEGTREARDVTRFLLAPGGVPIVARPAYGVLAAAAVALLPWWARTKLRLPMLPVGEAAVVKPTGRALVGVLRWSLQPTSPLTEAS